MAAGIIAGSVDGGGLQPHMRQEEAHCCQRQTLHRHYHHRALKKECKEKLRTREMDAALFRSYFTLNGCEQAA